MKNLTPRIVGTAAAIFIAAQFFSVETAAAKAGSSSAAFLKIGHGARGAAMADAQSAIVDDVTSGHWNPAGLSQMRFQEVSFMHHDLIESVGYQQAMYGRPTDAKGNFAFGINVLDYGDIDAYTSGGVRNGSVVGR